MNPGSAQNPLEHLKELHLPEAISLWPVAPGWIVLFIFLLAGLFAAGYSLLKYFNKNRYRRIALKKLNAIFAQYPQNITDSVLLEQVSQLIKTVAIERYSAAACARLNGRPWCQFLTLTSTNIKSIDTAIFMLFSDVYKPAVTLSKTQRQHLKSTASLWIQKHHAVADKEVLGV